MYSVAVLTRPAAGANQRCNFVGNTLFVAALQRHGNICVYDTVECHDHDGVVALYVVLKYVLDVFNGRSDLRAGHGPCRDQSNEITTVRQE